MAVVQMTVFARSDVGRVRANNEDAFTVTDLDTGERIDGATAPTALDVQQRGILLVVSDGMGGHAAGEVASRLVIDSLRKSLTEPGADISSMQRLIDNAAKRANADVLQAARSGRKKGMGATLTAVLVHHTEAYVAQVGDSRAYILRSGRLRQITKDQSFVQLLLDAGAITPEEARDSPQKNVILQAMGLEPKVQVSIGRLRLRRGDRLLVCCDGLSNMVGDEELAALLVGPDLADVCNRMIDLANERGGDDNCTAIVAWLDGEGLPPPLENERVTHTFEVLQDFGATAAKPPAPPSIPATKAVAARPTPSSPPDPRTLTLPVRPIWPVLAAIGAGLAIGLAAVAWWIAHR
jgi:serine/threonine protein phosphatase PrpC